MTTRLLTVEYARQLESTGVVVMPEAPAAAATFPASRTMAAELRRPDGSREAATITLQWTHFDAGGYRLMCVIVDVPITRIPIGSEVWCEWDGDIGQQ